MSHWASALLDCGWTPTGAGPTEFSCWNLVRQVFRDQRGIELPAISGESAVDMRALRGAARSLGFQQVDGPPKAWDIVVMKNRDGDHHVGVLIEANGRLMVLHSDGETRNGVHKGGVSAVTLKVASTKGYTHHEFWRQVGS